jgi:hypothetical protein
MLASTAAATLCLSPTRTAPPRKKMEQQDQQAVCSSNFKAVCDHCDGALAVVFCHSDGEWPS